ncbi:hypothetical protein CC78DRAFT_577274 [Lojkania enalia]|uniref:Uncharacterized protein n=1 Tax=Lojkania enalia TaxID=147567 RepID=A0A9P4KEU9_9PLEO|nr:hypothetical protein CC78DRAFT_577274 [Didymosphaeria enalia]
MSHLQVPATTHGASIRSPGLPAELHAHLEGRQRIESLYARRTDTMKNHYSTNSTESSSTSSFKSSYTSEGQRLFSSQIRHATRKALGPGFNPEGIDSHEPYYVPNKPNYYSDYRRLEIPQRYIDEFNCRWHEDDEDNDADQFIADTVRDALWRKHTPAYASESFDILEILSHVKQYEQEYGVSGGKRIPGFREDRHRNPEILFQKETWGETVNSVFEWDSSEDEIEPRGEKGDFHKATCRCHTAVGKSLNTGPADESDLAIIERVASARSNQFKASSCFRSVACTKQRRSGSGSRPGSFSMSDTKLWNTNPGHSLEGTTAALRRRFSFEDVLPYENNSLSSTVTSTLDIDSSMLIQCSPKKQAKARYYSYALCDEDKQALAVGEQNQNLQNWSDEDVKAYNEWRAELFSCGPWDEG